MTTKDQERKALEQITEIVESLGEESYIGMAMIGVLEDAKQNIENDWACNNYDRWQMAEQRVEELKQEVITLRERCDNLDTLRVEENHKVMELRQEVEEKQDAIRKLSEKAIETWNMFRAEEDKRIAAEEQIIRLKAKLYDMMIEKEERKEEQ